MLLWLKWTQKWGKCLTSLWSFSSLDFQLINIWIFRDLKSIRIEALVNVKLLLYKNQFTHLEKCHESVDETHISRVKAAERSTSQSPLLTKNNLATQIWGYLHFFAVITYHWYRNSGSPADQISAVHRISDWMRLEGDSGGHLVQATCSNRAPWHRTQSRWFLNISKGETPKHLWVNCASIWSTSQKKVTDRALVLKYFLQ